MVSMDQLNASFGHKERANSVMSVTNTLVEGSLSYFAPLHYIYIFTQVTHVICSWLVSCGHVMDVTSSVVFFPSFFLMILMTHTQNALISIKIGWFELHLTC